MKEKLVGVIAANNIRYSPYVYFYTNLLERKGIKYELIYPNRNNLKEHFRGESIELRWYDKMPTVLNYIAFSRSVKKTIKKKKYSKLIILTTLNATFLSFWLNKNYKDNYIVDIRDYTHENNYWYYQLEKIGLKGASIRVISSEKFKDFLPKNEYVVCHNITEEKNSGRRYLVKKEGPIIIGYVGLLAYVENCKKMIGLVLNDDRFELHFYGTGHAEKEIEKVIRESACDRIKMFGEYLPEEKGEILKKVDILFNAYGNKTKLASTLLSNKYYDAMQYKVPLINSPKTFMEEKSGIAGFSIDLDTEKSLEKLYLWYNTIDEKKVSDFQEKTINDCIMENMRTENIISYYLDK